jgi:hypothetical protein
LPEGVTLFRKKVLVMCPSFIVMLCYLQEKTVLILDFFEFLKPKNGAKTRKSQGKWENGAIWPIRLDIKPVKW